MADAPTNGNGNGGKWWLTWAPAIAASVVVVVAIGNYFATQGANQTTVAGLQTKVEELTRRMNSMSGLVQDLQVAKADTCQQLAKIETQFGITETIINKDNVVNQRHIDAVNAKLFGIAPSGIYYDIKIPHEVLACVH